MSGVAGLLLAAGGGRRFGGAKALVRTATGQRYVDRAVAALRDGGCDPVVVVLGAEADRVRAEATGLVATTVVDNPDWSTGMGSSLRRGLAALAATDAAAALVLLVDTPGIGPDAVVRIATAAGNDRQDALVVATYQGERGHPVLIGRRHWPGVADSAVADRGARAYLAARPGEVVTVECGDVAVGTDVDTPGDAARF